MKDDLLYQIAITKIPLVGPVKAKNLISYCGGVKEIFNATAKELKSIPGIGQKLATNILKQEVLAEAKKEIEFLRKYQVQPLFYLNDDYPHRLKHYTDCPVMLYYSGQANLNQERIIAIVGTRKPNAYGIRACEKIIGDLCEYQPLIISGLAYGIDITAHKHCIKKGIPTVGVLGHGLSRIYPHQHHQVARQMIRQGGLLTEYTSKTTPEREHFPMRNRIISGLCDALIVVQTGRKGGSIISAEIANTYHKEVFAIPGRVGDKQSEGCNHLIKSHKASLIESAADIAYSMGWDKPQTTPAKNKILLTSEEQKVYSLLKNTEAISIDKLTGVAQMESNQMAAILLHLEFKGVIQSMPGKRYALA